MGAPEMVLKEKGKRKKADIEVKISLLPSFR
jgi:hypothetical protein